MGKFMPGLSTAKKKNAICWASALDLEAVYTGSDSALKWIYAGLTDGTLINYPGFLWGDWTTREKGFCGSGYDVTRRPWYHAARTVLNVVIVMDVSGSMRNYDRLTTAQVAASAVIDSLTHTDFVSVIAFSTNVHVKSKSLVRARSERRASMKTWIYERQAGGHSYYAPAVKEAFAVLERSYLQSTQLGCHTIIVFLSDGSPDDPVNDAVGMFLAKRHASNVPSIQHAKLALYGLGPTVGSETFQANLKTFACGVDGAYTSVSQNSTSAVISAVKSYDLQSGFLSMFHSDEFGIVWSEPYESVPNIGMGKMVSVAWAFFDPDGAPAIEDSLDGRQHTSNLVPLIGVVGVDIPLCDLVEAAEATGWTEHFGEAPTRRGCTCSSEFTWQGVAHTTCTSDGWPLPWCAVVESDCGICDRMPEELPPLGCWDECDGTVEDQVVEFLRLRSHAGHCPQETVQEAIDPCVLECLRGKVSCGDDALTPCTKSSIGMVCNAMSPLRNPYNPANYTLYSPSRYGPVDDMTAPTACSGDPADNTNCGTCNAGIEPTCALKLCQEAQESGYCISAASTNAVLPWPLALIVLCWWFVGGVALWGKGATVGWKKPLP
eukprot:NODE_97_length_2134_cov_313.229437.p1 GENE.NODE_97_length_2134_cov_313.229437~~NODE_97_length_2134_cov_313.229437.p1  ORF type:complete len:604 (-),score=97.97 NODE_97_length_2134_cov_313.229437:305-2116(-)